MKKNTSIKELILLLKQAHPEATCSLDFTTPFELVIAVMLSAQCTDERVNKTTPAIFAKYNKPEHFANMDIHVLEQLIHSCGFYRNKAKNIIACSKKLLTDFGGEVPQTIEELTSLPGVGRKSANVVMLEAFNKPVGIAVDTHAKRISNRLGLSTETTPEKIELDLIKLFPKEYLKDINHLLVFHGRKICDSRNPKCDICTINHLCKYYNSL